MGKYSCIYYIHEPHKVQNQGGKGVQLLDTLLYLKSSWKPTVEDFYGSQKEYYL